MRPDPSERGAALLSVLLMVAVISVIAATAIDRLTLATRLAANSGALAQARAFAIAAEELAAVRIADLVDREPAKLTLAGGWNGRETRLPIPGGLASARISDGGNCFNLNSLVNRARDGRLVPSPIAVTQFAQLMRLLGISDYDATVIAAAAADWIDSDAVAAPGGAEDGAYRARAPSHLPANGMMAEISELRAVKGVTPAIYAQLRPWLCALPESGPSPININTLLPAQAPLFAMLLPGEMSVARARAILERRPAAGYSSLPGFWNAPEMGGIEPSPQATSQVRLTSRWFDLETTVELGEAIVQGEALIDAEAPGAPVVHRNWGVSR